MGKVRIKTFGDEEAEQKQKDEERRRREAKIAEKKQAAKQETTSDETSEQASTDADAVEEVKTSKKFVAKDTVKTKKHSESYQKVSTQIDRMKMYKLKEALEVLPKLKRAKFDETVELHINTTDKGISGQVTLPHGTGKEIRVAIATEELIANVEKGVIDFDVLIAEPQMMPKLAKVARYLGPRGLMPNPKNGTVSPNPEEAAKKFKSGAINFKTESKFPLLHLTVGKVSFGEDKLQDNIKALIQAVQTKNIKTAILKSTMSPGLKLDLASL